MKRSDRGLWIALGMLVVLLIVAGPFGRMGRMGGGMMGWAGRPGFMGQPGFETFAANPWMLGVGALMMVLFWAAIAIMGVLVIRAVSAHGHEGAVGSAPLDILQRRYAAGEITREQYEEAVQVLSPRPA